MIMIRTLLCSAMLLACAHCLSHCGYNCNDDGYDPCFHPPEGQIIVCLDYFGVYGPVAKGHIAYQDDNRAETIADIDRAFKDQGWILLRYGFPNLARGGPELRRMPYDKIQKSMKTSALYGHDVYNYTIPGTSTVLGYERVGGRSTYRYRSGKYVGEAFAAHNARFLRDPFMPMIMNLDDMLRRATWSLIPPLWKTTPEDLADEFDIPFLRGQGPDYDSYALFEAAYYAPFARSADEHLAVMAHYDPGFLSIGIWQSTAGLQFQDKDGKWVDMPVQAAKNVGVMWLGKAGADASGGRYKAAVHRVTKIDDDEGRLAVWSEICTREQVFRVMTDDPPVNYMPESDDAIQGMAEWHKRLYPPRDVTYSGFVGSGGSKTIYALTPPPVRDVFEL